MIWFLWLQAAALPHADTLVVRGDHLLLRHIVAAEAIPAGTSGDLRLLRAPEGTRTVLLTEADQVELLRRRLPTLQIQPLKRRALRINFDYSAATVPPRCFELNQPVAAGEAIDVKRVTPAACDVKRSRARLSYNLATRAPIAFEALATGSYLGPITVPSKLPEAAGQTLTLRTRVGPVTIDRAAVLMQPARTGRRAFVKLSDGTILSAALVGDGGDDDTE